MVFDFLIDMNDTGVPHQRQWMNGSGRGGRDTINEWQKRKRTLNKHRKVVSLLYENNNNKNMIFRLPHTLLAETRHAICGTGDVCATKRQITFCDINGARGWRVILLHTIYARLQCNQMGHHCLLSLFFCLLATRPYRAHCYVFDSMSYFSYFGRGSRWSACVAWLHRLPSAKSIIEQARKSGCENGDRCRRDTRTVATHFL